MMPNNEELLPQAKIYLQQLEHISVSDLQRKFLIGHQQASLLLAQLIEDGACGETFKANLGYPVTAAASQTASHGKFEPWIGSRYLGNNRFGLRVLVLGESHYGETSKFHPGFTTEIVRWLAQDERHSFFTKTSKVLLGLDKTSYLDSHTRGEVWEHIAFYNYIPEFVSENPRDRPTPAMWASAEQPFIETVRQLAPQVILVLGKALSSHLPKLPEHIDICCIQHPSTGFSYQRWNPVFAQTLQRAQMKMQNPPL